MARLGGDAMMIGIIGLPQSGKTTLFNAICGTQQATGGYTARGEVHRGVVKVPDPRLDELVRIYQPKKLTPAEIEWLDVAFFTGDTSDANRDSLEIPQPIREVSALAHVVRAFEDPNVTHPLGQVDPLQDIRALEDELILSDLVIVEKRIEKIAKKVQAKADDQTRIEHAALVKCQEVLNQGMSLRGMELTPEEEKTMRGFQLLSLKPKLIILNIDEDQLSQRDALLEKLGDLGPLCAAEVISARVQMELNELDDEDRQVFMEELGIEQSAFDRTVRKAYHLLGLIPFFTGGPKEVRAWTIKRGTLAPQAAGAIHKDFEKGFIKAEVMRYEKLIEAGCEAEAKKKGWMRMEGKEYEVKDGDVILFRFNV